VGGPGQRRPAQRPGASGAARAQVPLGAGLGLKHKYKKDGNVAVAIYGDGCQNQGQIYEARFPAHALSVHGNSCQPFKYCITEEAYEPVVLESVPWVLIFRSICKYTLRGL